MGGKTSKTNRTGRVFGGQRRHFCPACDEPSKLFMRMPGRAMHGRCEKGHVAPKTGLVLR
jgi:hypothetical protein